MGALLPARNNPFRVQGLLPGLSIRLDVSIGENVQSYVSRVEDVTQDLISVLVPIYRLRERPLRTGSLVHCSYNHGGKLWRFVTETAGHSDDGKLDYLRMPPSIETFERRNAFRLETALVPRSIYRIVIDPETADEHTTEFTNATIVDLSEGGICMVARASVEYGDWLGLDVDLPPMGKLLARMRVVGIDGPSEGGRKSRIHCVFQDLSRADRDRIARFLMQKQIEMRRRGQL